MVFGFEGGKAVVRAVVTWFNTVLGDETPFPSSLAVFEDNGVTLVNRLCSVVFVFLGLFADEGPGVFFACTPWFSCTPWVS